MTKTNISDQILGLQEHGRMERREKGLKITSIWMVPDLLFRGYQNPNVSRQFVVTLSQAITQKEFNEKVRAAFGIERQT